MLNFRKEIFELLEGSNDKWMKLKVGEEYCVSVSHFDDPRAFFIQIIDDSDEWDDMQEMLKKVPVLWPMTSICKGKMCLVEYDGELNRALITHCSEVFVACFDVDSGQVYTFYNSPTKIYEIPSKILNKMPFQAVCCQLSGYSGGSSTVITSMIYNKIIKRICQQRVSVVKELDGNSRLMKEVRTNVYEVVLFEQLQNGDKVSVIDTLIKNDMTN